MYVRTSVRSRSLPVVKVRFLFFGSAPLTVYDPVCSQAQAVTLTVAQAFRVAFEFWQAAKEGKEGPHGLTDGCWRMFRWFPPIVLSIPCVSPVSSVLLGDSDPDACVQTVVQKWTFSCVFLLLWAICLVSPPPPKCHGMWTLITAALPRRRCSCLPDSRDVQFSAALPLNYRPLFSVSEWCRGIRPGGRGERTKGNLQKQTQCL